MNPLIVILTLHLKLSYWQLISDRTSLQPSVIESSTRALSLRHAYSRLVLVHRVQARALMLIHTIQKTQKWFVNRQNVNIPLPTVVTLPQGSSPAAAPCHRLPSLAGPLLRPLAPAGLMLSPYIYHTRYTKCAMVHGHYAKVSRLRVNCTPPPHITWLKYRP